MIDDIVLHRDALNALCRRFPVRRLDLIGSAARDDFDPGRSDVDFPAEFDRARPPVDTRGSKRGWLCLKRDLNVLL